MSTIVNLDINTYKKAKTIRSNYSISFWNSLIIASALINDCSILYSEDMQHNLIIGDKNKIINPLFPNN